MKTDVECLSCFLKQTIRTTTHLQCSKEKQFYILQEVAAIISNMEAGKSPVANAAPVYEKISELTGCVDPYLELKKLSNRTAMLALPSLKAEIEKSKESLELAVRFAIAGNIIDYGAFDNFDVDDALSRSRTDAFAVDDFKVLKRKLISLKKGATILYLADNAGEIVYDTLLVELLGEQGYNLVIAVKGGPIINDALIPDAIYAGMEKFGKVITNGAKCPGTVLETCSAEFCDIFDNADLIIAKGQGNFESLSEMNREIFFLLTLKCVVAARHMEELSGRVPGQLKGRGEMAVYYSGKND